MDVSDEVGEDDAAAAAGRDDTDAKEDAAAAGFVSTVASSWSLFNRADRRFREEVVVDLLVLEHDGDADVGDSDDVDGTALAISVALIACSEFSFYSQTETSQLNQ